MRYLYEYLDSNVWCKFIDLSIYKIAEDHSVAVSQTKSKLDIVVFGQLSLLGGSLKNRDQKGNLNEEWPHISLHKKWSLKLRISLVNATKSVVFCGFGHICWRNSQWKTLFFIQCIDLPCYNKSEKELFNMKCLIVDRLTKGPVDVFMKCLKLVLVYKFFYKSKSQTARNKGFRTYVGSNALTVKPWK